MRRFSEEETKFYHEQGYIVVPDLFPKQEIAKLSGIVDQLVQRAAGLEASDTFFDLEPSHSRQEPRVRRLKRVMQQHEAFEELSRTPIILDLVEQLIGHGIRLSHPDVKINIKGASYGSPVEWHQDWAGYPHSNDDLLSVGIPLDDCAEENGPLMVLPGTHRGPLHDHHNADGVYCTTIDPVRSGLDFNKAVPLTGKAGMVTFHHARTVHGSALNRSSRSRRLLIYQFAAVDAWPLMGVSDLDAFNDTIVRGEPVREYRMVAAPVRIPRPLAPNFDGLYTSQAAAKNRYFETFGSQPAGVESL